MSAKPSRFPSPTAPGWIAVATIAGLAGALCIHLWPEWTGNPDLSHGLFAPILFVLLLREGRNRGPARYHRDTPPWTLLRAGTLVASLFFVALAGIYAAAVDWSHALVGFSLALALSALLLGALLWLSSDRVRLLPLNWTTFVAAAIWSLCAPLPPGSYARLTLQLQFWVTDVVLGSLHLLGIPAATDGNIIRLAHASVGVEEACSGVRSLLSCVVAAVFFSAALVRRPGRRVLLIALAPPLAFGMNIVRSLGLTLLANSGTDISGAWHDYTGFAVLGVTAAILGGLALRLEDAGPEHPTAPAQSSALAVSRPWGLMAAGLLVSAMLLFFALNTRSPSRPSGPVPDLAAILPVAPAGWDIVQTDDLRPFASTLRTDNLVQRTYVRTSAGGPPVAITIYIAYWTPGQSPVSQVAAHTPEACWPGAGWIPVPVAGTGGSFAVGTRDVPLPEYRAFTSGDVRQNVWYWHLYDGRSIGREAPRTAVDLLELALRYGFRTSGEQFFVRISSNLSWNEIRDEPLLTDVVNRLAPHGL